MYLFIIFVVLPIAEIGLLIEVGERIGTLNTVGFVVLTALVGSLMLRHQGLSTLFRARARIDSGELPLQEMLEGICLAVGGALLVTPGFITDVLGFICLLPGTRRWLVQVIASRVKVHTVSTMRESAQHDPHIDTTHGPTHTGRSPEQKDGDTIEGEFKREDSPDK